MRYDTEYSILYLSGFHKAKLKEGGHKVHKLRARILIVFLKFTLVNA